MGFNLEFKGLKVKALLRSMATLVTRTHHNATVILSLPILLFSEVCFRKDEKS